MIHLTFNNHLWQTNFLRLESIQEHDQLIKLPSSEFISSIHQMTSISGDINEILPEATAEIIQ